MSTPKQFCECHPYGGTLCEGECKSLKRQHVPLKNVNGHATFFGEGEVSKEQIDAVEEVATFANEMIDKFNTFKEIEHWMKVYELNFQFWPEQCAVYISRDGVNLADRGGCYDMQGIMIEACRYLRANNPAHYRKFQK